MSPEQLQRSLQVSSHLVRASLEGITTEESLRRVSSEAHSLNWVFGHILSSRAVLWSRMGQPDADWAGRLEVYARGSAEVTSATARGMTKLLAAFEASCSGLTPLLASLDPERLRLPATPPHTPFGPTLGDSLNFFLWHEGYHAGQLGLLRRALGHAGIVA